MYAKSEVQPIEKFNFGCIFIPDLQHDLIRMMIRHQYLLAQKSREAMITFIENSIGNQLTNPLPAFNNKSIRDLLVHSGACYLHWIEHFAFRQPKRSIKVHEVTTMADIRRLYNQVDEVMDSFFRQFGTDPELRINGHLDGWGEGVVTTLELFTHVMTHEFHHKGQVLSMCRQLGHIPPDTDVSISFSGD
jgi:uncharacterized damage-inducible protein DinB